MTKLFVPNHRPVKASAHTHNFKVSIVLQPTLIALASGSIFNGAQADPHLQPLMTIGSYAIGSDFVFFDGTS